MRAKQLPAKARERVAGVVGIVPLLPFLFYFLLVPIPVIR